MVVFKNCETQLIENQNIKRMKSKILALITFVVVTVGIAKSTYAAGAGHANFTVVNDISKINKIEIHGNVELFVSDGPSDQVKVYNHYYAESALVQSKNGTLRISSYSNEKLVVWVTANDLRSISAFDNAEVQSFGKLSKIDLDVDLHNGAFAKLNIDAYEANLTLTDHSSLYLSGSADQLNLNKNDNAKLKEDNLSVIRFTKNDVNTQPVNDKDDIAGV